MVITELLLSTLPSNRIYEFNLNYILKVCKDLDTQYKEKLPELVKEFMCNLLEGYKLYYESETETIYLKGVFVDE